MRILIAIAIATLGATALAPRAVRAQSTPIGWPPPAAVHTVLREIRPDLAEPLPGATNTEAYLQSLEPEVLWKTEPATSDPLLLRTNRYNERLGYLRVNRVEGEIGERLRDALRALASSGSLEGLLLDLRSAGGSDFPAALQAANLLAATLMEHGPKSGGSTTPGAGVSLPVAVLVNHRTQGSAEAFAGLLQQSVRPSIALGTNTAGQAREYREVSIPDAPPIRVAVGPYRLPNGTSLSQEGFAPDLVIEVPEVDEALYLEDPHQRVSAGRPVPEDPGARMNEAELARRRRGIRAPDVVELENRPQPVHDPVLARGIDLLDSLAALREAGATGVSR